MSARFPNTTMLKRIILAAGLLVVATATAAAQYPDGVQAGARVRVWIPESRSQDNAPWRRQLVRATVDRIAGDTLHLTIPSTLGTIAVPREAIRRLDVSRGEPKRVASAIQRAVGGAIVVGIWAALSNDPHGSRPPNHNSDWDAAKQGALFGAGVGALIGFVFPTEQWRRLRLPR